MQDNIETNRQDYYEKTKNIIEDLTTMITPITYHIKMLKSSPDKKDSPNNQDPTTVVPANKKAPQLEGGHSKDIGGILTLKHEISSPKFYELLIKTELKRDTALDLMNFYNHINMCLNEVNRLQEDFLTA